MSGEATSFLETSYHASVRSGNNDSSSSDDGEGVKEAAEKAAEAQFSSLVSHVLQSVQVTGRAYEYKKTD